jgi:hypothetical protein
LAPRLYLILSNRSGLVKIGRTEPAESSFDDAAVIERVRRYSTGISDSATVVQAPGAAIFETWLHQFVEKKRKPVTIRFAFRPGLTINPKEWFELSPELAQILAAAFVSEPPQKIDDVDIANLPVFLSGAMAVIRWHGENESAEALAAMAARAEVRAFADKMRFEQPHTVTPVYTSTRDSISGMVAQSDTVSTAAHDLLTAPANLARLQVQMQALEESERLRTYIAITVAFLVFIIWLFGSPVGATWFAILGTLLLAFWPNALPRAARWIIDRLQKDAETARSKNHAGIEDE